MSNSELTNIIQQGEGYFTEFKSQLNNDFKKEIVAFANASGGNVYLGINDDGTLSGLKVTNKLLSQIQEAASECDPPIRIQIVNLSDNLVQVIVPESINKPHRTTTGFYLRVGANSQKMKTDSLIDFIEKEGRIRFDERVRFDVDFDSVFSVSAWKKFAQLSGISETLDYHPILRSLGALAMKNDTYYFTNAGILMFTEKPALILPHAYITGVAYRTKEKVDIVDNKDFNSNLPDAIDEALNFVERHINVGAKIIDIIREDVWEIPKVALREAITNAVVHRDYLEKGARVMVEVFPDRIVVSNPGGLTKGLSEKEFGNYSLTRNSVLANLMLRAHFIEKLGTGIGRIKQAFVAAGLLEPVFLFNGFFAVKFRRIETTGVLPVDEPLVQYQRRSPYKSGKTSEKSVKKIGKISEKIQETSEKPSEKTLKPSEKTLKNAEKSSEKIEKPSEKTGKTSEKMDKTSEKSEENVGKSSEKTSEKILIMIRNNPKITINELSSSMHKSTRAIELQLSKLKQNRRILREGPDKGGRWLLPENGASV